MRLELSGPPAGGTPKEHSVSKAPRGSYPGDPPLLLTCDPQNYQRQQQSQKERTRWLFSRVFVRKLYR